MYFRRCIRNILCAFLGCLAILNGPLAGNSGAAAEPAAGNSAVVVMYHRFGETRYPSTNVTIEQFEAHIAELQSGGYTVLALPAIIKALKSGKPLPKRTVGISIESSVRMPSPRLKPNGTDVITS